MLRFPLFDVSQKYNLRGSAFTACFEAYMTHFSAYLKGLSKEEWPFSL